MPVYVAMLRGINVRSRTRVAMGDLVDLITGAGGTGVSTYVQSGNAIFAAAARSPGRLEHTIETATEEQLGMRVRVLIRTPRQLAAVVAANPFGAPDGVHVTFLAERPAADRRRAVEGRAFPPDECRVIGREVYVRCPKGYGRTKLNNAYMEKQLGVAATTRNWNTVVALLERARSHAG